MKILRLVGRFFVQIVAISAPSLAAMILAALVAQAGSAPLKIFILSGQSNMVGLGLVDSETNPGTVEYTVAHDTDNTYQFAADGAGGWASFEDVWMYYDGASGDLTTGYAYDSSMIGPELGFGYAVGNYFGEQVLLIKAAWVGRSLAVDFRPPSSGGTTGSYYAGILTEVSSVIANLSTYFPDYDPAEGYELAGFCWHQGWSDHSVEAYAAQYETNMVNFIRDIRNDLGS
ncbi:sialate O-acetylesterase [Pontiella sp.]|uniref:sialate O-acetylesterase n=1 Tax=Pontiella sp. TaxID=2837462 RepID=UPI00356514C3